MKNNTLTSEILTQNIKKYIGEDIDLSTEAGEQLIEEVSDLVLNMIPKVTKLLSKMGEEYCDPYLVLATLATIGMTIGENASYTLSKAKEGKNEKLINNITLINNGELQ